MSRIGIGCVTVIFAAVALVSLTGCGGNDAKQTEGDSKAATVNNDDATISNGDIEKYFKAISNEDPDEMAQVEQHAAPGSVAAAYLQEQTDAVNAQIDGGGSVGNTEFSKVDGGYKNCATDENGNDACVTWSGFESDAGKLAKFKINDIDISDRISVGDGSKKAAGSLATVEFLSAYKSVQSGYLFVNLKITTKADKINIDSYGATYRGTDKRQLTAVSAAGPTELGADSTATVSVIFKAAKAGGTIQFDIADENYNKEATVSIKTQ